ncbi:putative sporulation protein YtxC [Paenibacillus humicola]|uniref:putative sporulation protein YtxC n=1 Tax=Paenibacillus humicola TaxID=3110540 RepID=UPI00237A83C7|nr:putative sporulation protein YtxC [Paenibacillus humicola]
MEIFTVSIMSATYEAIDRLHGCLNEEFADLHSAAGLSGHSCSLEFSIDRPNKRIRCTAKQRSFNALEAGPFVMRKAANAFAEYILTELEPLLLKAIIRKQFHYEREDEIETIERYCAGLLSGGTQLSEETASEMRLDRDRRRNKVAAELELFLSGCPRIHLDGFVTFRLASYWEELREIAAYAVDEYVMDKQYQEFISLLKYFVRMQEVKLPIVHVLHKGGSEFALYDEQHRLIDSAPADRIVAEMLESEMNMEDMIVSTLITVSPQHIVIHTRQPDLQVMRTLETIFEQRVRLCTHCASCGEYFGESVAQPAKAAEPKPVLPAGSVRT